MGKPIIVFGGGKTRTGVVVPSPSVEAGLTESVLTRVEHITLRASNGNPATFRQGERYPVLTQSFGPQVSPALLKQFGGNIQFTPPIPGFAYEDLGITLKATPEIHGTSSVTLDLELYIRALEGSSINGIPVISNREYKGTVGVLNGASAVLMGSVTEQQDRSTAGLPGLGEIPVVGRLANSHSRQGLANQLIVVITPYIIRSRSSKSRPATEVSN